MHQDEKSEKVNNPVIQDVPQEALTAIREQTQEAGGEFVEPPEFRGSLGRTMYDTPSSADGTVSVPMPKESIEHLPRQSLVRIKSIQDRRSYLGIVVSGPFAEPDGLRADAPILISVNVRGAILMPKYHGRAQVELLGEELSDGSVVPPRRRPLPNSPVFALTDEEVIRVLRIGGNIRLGVMEGSDKIEIRVPSNSKAVFPRHVGILGTTGGGKSTTVSGMIDQLQQSGASVVIFDTEGEYTAMYEPTNNQHMLSALQRRGLKPQAIPNTHVYCLVGRETRNPDHPDVRTFRLDFSAFSPYALTEIMGLSPAQELRFLQTYDTCKLILRDLNVYPARGNQAQEREALELDELETGYPNLTLSILIDIAGAFRHVVAGDTGNPQVFNRILQQQINQVMQRVNAVRAENEISWRGLLARLWRLHRLQIFDNPQAQSLNFSQMLQPGHTAIIDLSDTDSPQVNNLVIAQLLKGIQREQDNRYQRAVEASEAPPLTVVMIEEAHEFLSAERIKEMPVLFQQVARIARRGRKRWLSLAFITQLPQHLPDEALGLINSWILHKINDSGVVNRLRKSIGGIDDGLWTQLPRLAPGQAIISFTSLTRPLMATIDPSPCKLLMTE